MENTYILYDESGSGIIIDPGCYTKEEEYSLKDFIQNNRLKIELLVNTHCHIDHVLGNAFVKKEYGVDLVIHEKDDETLKANEIIAPIYGFNNYNPAHADRTINEGDTVKFGQSKLEVLFVPGHAPGHIALVNKDEGICIGGDVLFNGSIGRTDLPGGNFDTLMKSIKEKMYVLDDDMVVYPGHGPSTTISHEKKSNPFCSVNN